MFVKMFNFNLILLVTQCRVVVIVEKKRISEYIGNVKLEQGVESIGSEKLAKEEAEQKVSEDDGDKDLYLFECKGCRMAWARAFKKILERPRPDDWMVSSCMPMN